MPNKILITPLILISILFQTVLHGVSLPPAPRKERHFAQTLDVKTMRPLTEAFRLLDFKTPTKQDIYQTPKKKRKREFSNNVTPANRKTRREIKELSKNKIRYSKRAQAAINQAKLDPSARTMAFIKMHRRLNVGDIPASRISGSTPEKESILHKLSYGELIYALEHGTAACFQHETDGTLIISLRLPYISATYLNIRSESEQLKQGWITFGFTYHGLLYHAKFEARPRDLGIALKPTLLVGDLDENNQLVFRISTKKK